ncbi:MAG TPA: FlgD immunoglobulin-like domain containing protein, partial [Bacteroidales bacterium]|nr:FlgD immunoglobulin-like domain containing protein [Bacteroidales bacterium]
SKNRKVYPIWTDNRSGSAMSYVSPVDLGPPPNQPFMVYDSYSLTLIGDTGTIPSMNFGDSLYLSLGIKNIGDQPVSAVTAAISSLSPYIAITDSLEYYGDFAAGELKILPHGYSFKVSDTIPDGERVKFSIRITGPDTTWNSSFSLTAHAPHLRIADLTIVDTAVNCNYNNHLDPGETLKLSFKIVNDGEFSCTSAYTKLRTSSLNITLLQDSVFLGTILPRASGYVVFDAQVSEDATFGSYADLIVNARTGMYQANRTFIETIGVVAEDWETGGFNKFPWTFIGNSTWKVTNVNPFEGIYSAKSGYIFEDQSSILKIDYTSGVDDSISFFLKTSSENSFDFLRFYIDNVKQNEWSGEIDWTRVAFPTLSGTHNYKWTYMKDNFLSVGEDCAWVDYIEFPPPVLPEINAGPNDTICAGMVYHLSGSASLYDSLKWTTYGDGIFSNDTLVNPIYTPGSTDITNGQVKLRLTGWGSNGTTTRSMLLYIGSIPVIDEIAFWPEDTVCANHFITLSVDTINGADYLWTPGNFTTPEIELDTAVTSGMGTFRIKVRITSRYHCSSSDSIPVTFQDCTGIAEKIETSGVSIFPNPFSGETTIHLRLLKPAETDLVIIDETGRTIRHLLHQYLLRGIFTFVWNGKDDQDNRVAPGIYYVSLSAGEKKSIHKIILLP